MATDSITVSLEQECSETELTAVSMILETAGVSASVRRGYSSVRTDVYWYIIIGLASRAAWIFFKAALQAAGDEAGKDGWRALKELLKDLRSARRAPESQGRVEINIYDQRVHVFFEEDLPDLAYQRLFETDSLPILLTGDLSWDESLQFWTISYRNHLLCDFPGCQEPATQRRVRSVSERDKPNRCFCDVHVGAADAGDPQAWA